MQFGSKAVKFASFFVSTEVITGVRSAEYRQSQARARYYILVASSGASAPVTFARPGGVAENGLHHCSKARATAQWLSSATMAYADGSMPG